MIKPLKEQQAKIFLKRFTNSMERVEFFPEPSVYYDWIGKIAEFIESKGGTLAFAVERYKGDLEFFTAESKEEYAIIFISQLVPCDLVFFGMDWIISISSYPQYEYSNDLEYSVRFYGAASIIGSN